MNRLQTRLDEEEFGMVDPPAAAGSAEPSKTETPAPPAPTKTTPAKDAAPKKGASSPEKEIPTRKETGKTIAAELEAKSDDATPAAADPAPVLPIAKDMSFEEKKRMRAKRFNMPIVSTEKKQENNNHSGKRKNNNNIDGRRGNNNSKNGNKRGRKEGEAKPRKSKEELETLLKRAERFGDEEKIRQCKTELRFYRFESASTST